MKLWESCSKVNLCKPEKETTLEETVQLLSSVFVYVNYYKRCRQGERRHKTQDVTKMWQWICKLVA